MNEGLFFRRADGKEIPVKEVEGLKGNGLLILTTEMLLRDEDLQKIQQSIEKRIGDGTRVLMLDARIKKEENDMATPWKECPNCGAHLDSGETCDCMNTNNDETQETNKEAKGANNND